MKILSLGLDNSILNKTSVLAGRIVSYGELVEKYAVVVPAPIKEKTELSAKAVAYSSGGENKFVQLINTYFLAEKLFKENQFDVITVQDQYFLALVGWLLKKKLNAGLEIQVHGWEKYYGLRKLIAKYVLPRADAVRCVSQRLKKQLVSEFGVQEANLTVVPIYVEVKGDQALGGAAGLKVESKMADGKFIFLTVGRLAPVKNIGLLIKALAEVVKQHPRAELWLVGDGPERERLRVEIKKSEVDSRVKFLGFEKDVSRFYARADAFALVSDAEGWGMAVIEAAGFGLPIIMTDVGCAGEVIKNNDSGLVVTVGSLGELVNAMEALLKNEELRRKLGQGARKALEKLPSKEKTLELYLESWNRAAAR